METKTGRQVLETWFRRVWQQGDLSAIDEMFPAPAEATGLGDQPLIGPEDFRRFHQAICRLLSDIEISVDKSVEQGDWVSALITIRAICRQSGRAVSFPGNVFARTGQGRILEAYNHLEFMSLWSQLGFLPTDCFELALQGKAVA